MEIVGGEKLRKSDKVGVKHRTMGRKPSSPSLKRLGAGVQGLAVERTKKTNVVTKVFGMNDARDGYYRFLKFCQDHQNNPYLPKIYKLRVYDKEFNIDSDGLEHDYELTGVVDLEKLVPINHPKIKDAIVPQLKRLGLPSDQSKRRRTNHLIDYYNSAVERGSIERDEQFEQVVDFLENSSKDLHSGNVMARLTSTGPQLVIIDPVWEP